MVDFLTLNTHTNLLFCKNAITDANIKSCCHAIKTLNTPRARSIQPKFQPVQPGKVVHLKRWTRCFETFPVGPNVTDPLSFGPKFPEILVEWIAPQILVVARCKYYEKVRQVSVSYEIN